MMSVAKRPATAAGTIALRPRARILRTFGDELISSETVAVIELVKNAYDADATRVLVRFQGPLEIDKGSIEVIDNGHGMSLDTILDTWMEPATLMRKRNPRSEQRGRRVLGEKGIGRFAASRLANRLTIVTRRAGTENEVRVELDWSEFDDEEAYLDQIRARWQESEPGEICPGGTIDTLWKEGEKPNPGEPFHGTILRMEGLRAHWQDEQFVTLRTGLSRLTSPFFNKYDETGKDEFRISLQLPPPFEHRSGIVEPSDALKNPHYVIKGFVDRNSKYNLTIKLPTQENEQPAEGRFFPSERTPLCGPFYIELRVWDREAKDLAGLVKLYDSTLKDVRGDLDRAAGINIYRDGFRVLPYGEPRNDWLRLDLRRVQNPTLRLSNNQIVGYVLISADDNPQLRDQSNREGIIEGPSLDDLRALVEMVLARLEQERYNIRPRQKHSVQSGGLFAGFDLASIHDLIKQRHPEDTELLALIGEKEQDLERRVEEVQEVLARYRRLAALGQLIDIVLHDGRAPLSKITSEALLGLRDIARANNNHLASRLHKRLETIKTQSDVLATVFRRIEPFGGRKRGRPTNVRLEQVITDAFSVLDTEIKEVGATVSLPNTDTQVNVDQAEIQQVIINLLQNSLYWLRQVPKSHRHISVAVNRKDLDEVEVMFSDTGPGIDPKFGDLIFDPYFSTKPDGIGLGLTIAGEIVSEYYKGDLELLDSSDQQQGVTFRIALRRRV